MPERNYTIEAVQKILGEPVICEFDAKTQKIRTTLFLLSIICIGYILGGLKIEENSSFLGLKFEGLDDTLFRYILIMCVSYLLIHFIWCAIDSFFEWRLRITGSKVGFRTGTFITSSQADYPNDPRQSTLYNWWASHTETMGGFDDIYKNIIENYEFIRSEIKSAITENNLSGMGNVAHKIETNKVAITELRATIDAVNTTFSSNRIPASLERFDNWYKYFLKSQNLRWLFIEFLLPILLAIYAICLMGFSI